MFLGMCGSQVLLLPVAGAAEPRGLLVLHAAATERDATRTRATLPREAAQRPTGQLLQDAVKLLLHLAREAEHTQSVRELQGDVVRLRRAVAVHEREEAWLRRALQRLLPMMKATVPGPAIDARTRGIVGLVLERIHRDYRRPLVLSAIAQELEVSASHLSFLFARQVGMPFKSYLTALRIQMAQELLRDPRQRISEVAFAVGYGSPERFRAAFRQRTGLSPNRWRATLTSA